MLSASTGLPHSRVPGPKLKSFTVTTGATAVQSFRSWTMSRQKLKLWPALVWTPTRRCTRKGDFLVRKSRTKGDQSWTEWSWCNVGPMKKRKNIWNQGCFSMNLFKSGISLGSHQIYHIFYHHLWVFMVDRWGLIVPVQVLRLGYFWAAGDPQSSPYCSCFNR